MNNLDQETIKKDVAPLIQRGEASLLLGAGFSIVNNSLLGKIPSGEGLRDMILEKCGRSAGKNTTLKDAYLLGSREIKDFPSFLSECFTVKDVFYGKKKYLIMPGVEYIQPI